VKGSGVRSPWWLHQVGAKGRAGTKVPKLGCQSEGAAWLVYCSASELSSSESMSGGSGLSKKDGRFFGMYFSPVKVNAPESLMNSVSIRKNGKWKL